MSKKVVVKKIDEDKKEIVLGKKDKSLIVFFRSYWLVLFITALILSLTVFALSVIYTVSSLFNSNSPTINKVPLDVSFGDELVVNVNDLGPISDDYANNLFKSNSNVIGNNYGIILVNDIIKNSDYQIVFYSDSTAKKVYDNGRVVRISSLADGSYGINDNGDVNVEAKTMDITITKKEKFSYGVVTYYSDGSAEVLSGDGRVEMLIRDSNYLFTNNVLNSGVAIVNGEDGNVTKYSDGTILILKDNTYYVVNDSANINDSTRYFNEVNRVNLSDGREVIYFANGSAIIKDDINSLSIRKGNAINISNNRLYDITDSNYVSVCDVKNMSNGDVITFYSDGSAIKKSGNSYQYIMDSNNVIMDSNGNLVRIDGTTLDSKGVISDNGNKVVNFGDTSLVELNNGSIIIGKNDDLTFDSLGNFIGLNTAINDDSGIIKFRIGNNKNETIKYMVVLEESERSELAASYIKYKISGSSTPLVNGNLSDKLWVDNKELAGGLNVEGTNYILLEGSLEEYEVSDVNLLLYIVDTGTVQNEIMNKYYYGTIKVYAWIEE